MYIKYDNLIIRNATQDDAEQLAVWWNDGKIMAHAGFPNGIGQTADDIASSLKTDSDDTHRRLIIEIDNVVAGEMNYRNKGDWTAEIGIKICDFSKRNKGTGKIFLSMLIFALYNDYGYQKIIVDTNEKNERAQHVYEQLGFKKVRTNKNSWTNQIGELQSSIDYELYKQDFCNFTSVTSK